MSEQASGVKSPDETMEEAVSIAVANSIAAPVPGIETPLATAMDAGATATVGATQEGSALLAALPTDTQARIENTMEKVMKTAEEMVSFGQGNVEAFMKSGQIWAAGVQDLGKHLAASAQAQIDETLSTFRAIAGVKSVKEAIELQSTLARSGMEKAVAASGKITDASVKLAEQAIAPLTARVTLAVEKFSRAA